MEMQRAPYDCALGIDQAHRYNFKYFINFFILRSHMEWTFQSEASFYTTNNLCICNERVLSVTNFFVSLQIHT